MLTREYTRGQLKVTCESLTSAWQTLCSYVRSWTLNVWHILKRHFGFELLRSLVVWILRVSVWGCWASLCVCVYVCWHGANHLLIMSPWRRGQHAMYGGKSETWHTRPSHNLTGDNFSCFVTLRKNVPAFGNSYLLSLKKKKKVL